MHLRYWRLSNFFFHFIIHSDYPHSSFAYFFFFQLISERQIFIWIFQMCIVNDTFNYFHIIFSLWNKLLSQTIFVVKFLFPCIFFSIPFISNKCIKPEHFYSLLFTDTNIANNCKTWIEIDIFNVPSSNKLKNASSFNYFCMWLCIYKCFICKQ